MPVEIAFRISDKPGKQDELSIQLGCEAGTGGYLEGSLLKHICLAVGDHFCSKGKELRPLELMDLIESLRQIANRAKESGEYLQTEEATKNALVMPFLNALGYNVFDPSEVIPEFTADIGTKKGEKVDYALIIEGNPVILVECKTAGAALDINHASQLFRYFSVTEARVAILTNGVEYRFYTDIESPNKMDERPFYEVNILNLDQQAINELKKFRKSAFDIEGILSNASELKYMKEIKAVFEEQLEEPSPEFVKLMASSVYSGRFTSSIQEQFTQIVKKALQEFLKERIRAKITSAFEQEGPQDIESDEEVTDAPAEEESDIETTEEELHAYNIVRAILAKEFDVQRIALRDVKSYCGVLLDDNNRKPICRFWFNSSQKYLGLFDAEKKERKMPIESAEEIFKYSDDLLEIVQYYTS